MQFNGHADDQDIVSLVVDATGMDKTNDIKQITRATNRANKIVWSWVFESYGGWQYDDSNNTDLPFARTNLVSGQNKYTIPSETLSIESVEVQNSSGTHQKVLPLPYDYLEQGRSEEEFQDQDGTPRYYNLVANVIKLYPTPNESVSNGLRLRINRGSISFASTDTTKSPGFISEFHEAVSDGASYYLGINKNLPNIQGLQAQWNQWEDKIKKYYAQRWAELYPKEIKNADYTSNVI